MPAYDLAAVTDEVHSGTSRHDRRWKTTNIYNQTGRTRHYRNRTRLMCLSCRVTRFMTKALAAGIAFGLYLYWSEAQQPASRAASSNASFVSSAIPPADDVADEPSDAGALSNADLSPERRDAEAAAGGESASSDLAASEDNRERRRASSRELMAAQIASDPLSVPAVADAVEAALGSGAAERWKAAKLRGYAVPSMPGVDGCRMIQVSIDTGERPPAFKRCPTTTASAVQ